MGSIEVFEPAMCCSTGLCGPDVPQELVTFSADLDWLRSHGGAITRYNLASEPANFAGRPAVAGFLQLAGSEGLPLVLVDGTVAMTGRYPDRAQLTRWAGLTTELAGSADPGLAAALGGRADPALTAEPAGQADLELTTVPAGRTELGITETGERCCGGSSGCC